MNTAEEQKLCLAKSCFHVASHACVPGEVDHHDHACGLGDGVGIRHQHPVLAFSMPLHDITLYLCLFGHGLGATGFLKLETVSAVRRP